MSTSTRWPEAGPRGRAHRRPQRPIAPHRTGAVVVAAVLLATPGLAGQGLDPTGILPELEGEIRRQMMDGGIPGLSVALVADGQVVLARGYGYANLWSRTPASARTVYTIASTYKTISAAVVARLWEEGTIDLDEPVRDHLAGLSIRGEEAGKPVTFRHLLTHTSGMGNARGAADVWSDSLPPTLAEYLPGALALEQPTESGVRYSNLAFASIPYLVENITGDDYRSHVHRHFFEPLGMTDTDFFPHPAMEERLSIPYVPNDQGQLRPVARYKAVDWAAGVVYGTAPDLARWLAANLAGGIAPDGRRVLEEATITAMHTVQFPAFRGTISGWGNDATGFGLTWWVSERRGERLIAHSGSVPGQTAFMVGNVDRGVGIVILSNGHRGHPYLYAIANRGLELLELRSPAS